MTDDRLLTPDELAAIRDYITGWEPARDRRFLEAARMLLDHTDAQDAELARLRDALAAVCKESEFVYFVYKDGEHTSITRRVCVICGKQSIGKPLQHAPGCPIAAARALLEGGA